MGRFAAGPLLLAVLLAGCAQSRGSSDDGGDARDDAVAADDGDTDAGCRPGFSSCAGLCVDRTTDPDHCGACDNRCASGEVCNESACSSSCRAGLANCTGACVDLQVDPVHCGSCTTPCLPNEECRAGVCECVPACTGRECGDDGCRGSCGTGCAAGEVCNDGTCASTCADGLENCSGVCADLQTDASHCGDCAFACGRGEACVAGACTCVPVCTGRECGNDGCDATCPPGCDAGWTCRDDGRCDCDGVPCGPLCCPADQVCSSTGACCTATCGGRECGDDGCGGTCGDCPVRFTCGSAGECVTGSACGGAAPPAATAFGFDYGVPGYLGAWYGTDWAAAEASFRRDVKVMAALGTRVVRVMLFPYASGMALSEGAGNVGDPAALAAATTNLPTVVRTFREHGIAVVLALGPNALYWNGPLGDTRRWWDWAYGAGGWTTFVNDVATWGREIVEAVESSDACDGVLYWDLLNEADYRVAGMSELVRTLLNRVPVPDARRGISVLLTSDAAAVAADGAATGKSLAFIDVHSYPDRAHNPDVPAALAAVRAAVPGARALLGEYAGIYCENGQNEDAQRDTEAAVLDGAVAGSALAVMHWMLWDQASGRVCGTGDNERTGLGYSPDEPRDNWGMLAERRSRLPGGDFEGAAGGWGWGGTGPDGWSGLGGPSETDAATNLYYLRLMITGAGTYWLCSPIFDISGTRAAIAGYVRSSAAEVWLDLNYRDALGWSQDTGRAPLRHTLAIPAGWQFHNVQSLVGGAGLDLPAGTVQGILCFAIVTADAGPTYVDVDGISINAY